MIDSALPPADTQASTWGAPSTQPPLLPGGRRTLRPQRLRVDLVDVRHATVHPVRIWADGAILQIAGRGLLRQVPLNQIDWHHELGPQPCRTARLPDGSALCAIHARQWDDWCTRTLTFRHPGHGRTRPLIWLLALPLVAAMGLLAWLWPNWMPGV